MLIINPPDYKFCPFCGKLLGIKIEEEKERKFCSFCNWTYYPHVAAAAGVVIVQGQKVLMVQRNRDPYKGTWMYPAGFVDFGEHPEDTAIREAKEETGLEVRLGELLKVVQIDDDPRSSGHFMFFYKASASSDQILNKDSDENTGIAWVDINNPPPIGWHGHKLVMKKLQEKKF